MIASRFDDRPTTAGPGLAWRRRARSILSAVGLAVGLAALPLSSGCGAGAPARVERGEPPATGNASYDDYFKQVQEAREDADEAKKDVDDARAALAKALELNAKSATFDEILDQTAERAKKLRERGVTLHLELVPDARLVTTAGKALDPWAEDILRGIEGASKKWLAVTRKMIELSGRAADLQKTRAELREGADSALGARASEVTEELDASTSVLESAASVGLKQAGVASRFLVGVALAVEADGAVKPKAAGRAGSPPRAAGKPQVKAQGSTGGAASPTPPPPPAKPKPKGDDFEP